VKELNRPHTAAAAAVHWGMVERLGLPSMEEQLVVPAVLEKVLVCAVNMRQLGYLPAADPGRVEEKTGRVYELSALEHLVCEHCLPNQEYSCLEEQNCHFLQLPAKNS
jgi:hypothetical protein